MPNIPSPISETDEEAPSSSTDSYFPHTTTSSNKANGGAPNFSRPRIGRGDSSSTARQLHRDPDATSHTIDAFYEPNRDFPDEPRFSLDSEQTTSTSENSAGSEFAWDGERGELRAVRRKQQSRPAMFDQQRVSMEGQRRAAGSRSGTAERHHQPPPNEMPASSSGSRQSSRGGPTITKRTSLEQRSHAQRRSSESGYEDNRSHHTVSESGDSGSFDMEGHWQSSDYDYSGLSAKEVAKLRKKGVNPALYAEMKAAKKGRNKWIGSLSGNTFLS